MDNRLVFKIDIVSKMVNNESLTIKLDGITVLIIELAEIHHSDIISLNTFKLFYVSTNLNKSLLHTGSLMQCANKAYNLIELSQQGGMKLYSDDEINKRINIINSNNWSTIFRVDSSFVFNTIGYVQEDDNHVKYKVYDLYRTNPLLIERVASVKDVKHVYISALTNVDMFLKLF